MVRGQELRAAGGRRHAGGDLRQQGIEALQALRELRRLLQRLPQAHQLARAHLAQRDARGDALDVAAALEFGAQRLPQALAQQA